jgi:hypothetical protein
MARERKKKPSWKDQRHTLEQRREAVDALVNRYQTESDEELCRMISELNNEKERLKNELQQVSERLEAVGQTLDTRWEPLGISSIEVDGVTYSREMKIHASVANKEVYFAWLRENGMEVLIQETVAAKTTEALVKERLEDGHDVEHMGLSLFYKSVVK